MIFKRHLTEPVSKYPAYNLVRWFERCFCSSQAWSSQPRFTVKYKLFKEYGFLRTLRANSSSTESHPIFRKRRSERESMARLFWLSLFGRTERF